MEPICIECGNVAEHAHHVVPRSLGGTATVPLCGRCHATVHGAPWLVGHNRLVALGLDAARARGVKLGRPFAAGPSPAEVTRLRAEGASWAQVAGRLNCTVALARRRAANV